MPSISGRRGPSQNRSSRRSAQRTKQAPKQNQTPAAAQSRDIIDLSAEARNGQLPSIDEKRESSLLKHFGKQGGLVKLKEGGTGAKTLTIHGINSAPDSVKALSEASAKDGQDVYTYAYDDQHTRLGKTSDGLAKAISKLQQDGQPLNIRAHSMGGRLAVDALRKMQASGVIKGQVHLEMTNPVLGGFSSANSARFAPVVIDGLIPGVKPGKDMGNKSSFQKTLETTTLPPNVKTTTYVGDRDKLVNPKDKHFQAVHDGLNGKVKIVPGGGHDNTINTVARKGK